MIYYTGTKAPKTGYSTGTKISEKLKHIYYTGELPSSSPNYKNIVISANNYIDLVNAKANGLSYLKLFGACEQASTPTPTNPVNIVCNNGTIKVRDKELPSGYKRVKDIIYNNNSYFETAYTMSGSDTMKVSFTKTTSGACNLVGAYDGATPVDTNFSIYLSNLTNGKFLRYNGSLFNSYAVQDTRYDLIMTPTGTQCMEVDSTWEEKEFTSTNTFCIGTTAVSATSAKFIGILHGNIEIVNKVKFIPCERTSDSALGYYDTTAETFLENQGTGTLTTSGYDYDYLEFYVDGTTETVRINPKNLFDKNAITQGYMYNTDIEYVSSASAYLTDFIHVSSSTTYVCSYNSTGSGIARINYFDSNKDILSQTTATTYNDSTPFTFTTPSSTAYIRISFNLNYVSASTVQIEQGTTATNYQPYLAGTAQNLFGLSDYQDVQDVLSGHITRKIGMMILTGEEDWSTTSSATTFRAPLRDNPEYAVPDSELACMCTHYNGEKPKVTISSMSNNSIKCGYKNAGYTPTGYIYLKDNSFESVSDVTDYLAGQYVNGTPVILVYPLDVTTSETVTGQHLQIEQGNNTIEITQASIDPLKLEIKYKAGVPITVEEIEEVNTDNSVEVTIK